MATWLSFLPIAKIKLARKEAVVILINLEKTDGDDDDKVVQ